MALLTAEQALIFSAELQGDPTGRGYQGLLSQGMLGHVIDTLNALTETMHKETWITDLTIMAKLGADMYRSIMGKLDAIAPMDVAVRDFIARLRGASADIGHPNTLDMIDALATLEAPAGFTPDEVTALKGLSLQPASRMEVLRLPYAQEQMLGGI